MFLLILQVRHGDDAIIQAAVFHELLAVAGHDALVWREAIWIHHSRGAEERDVRPVDVTGVHHVSTLEAHQDLAVREERVLVELQLALNRTSVGDTDVDAVSCESIAATEVVQLFILRGDIGTGYEPVRRTTERGSVDDVRDFNRLVEQRDVAIGEVNRGTSGRREVVLSADRGGDQEVIDDFAVDFSNHFIGHEIRQCTLCIDVVNRLEILSSFQGPAGLELTSEGAHRIRIDAHRHFGLERVVLQVVLVAGASNESADSTTSDGDRDRTGRVVEVARYHRENGRVLHSRELNITRGIKADLNLWFRISFTAVIKRGAGEEINNHGTSENRLVNERAADGTAGVDEIFTIPTLATNCLAAVVRVKCPAVLTCELSAGVLTHDLRSGNRLALRDAVAVADVENERCRLAHGLDANEVIRDQLRIGLADERECEARKVRDVAGLERIFKQHRAALAAHGLVLVLEESSHQTILLVRNFRHLREDRSPTLDVRVLLCFNEQHRVLALGFRDRSRFCFTEVLHGKFSYSIVFAIESISVSAGSPVIVSTGFLAG